ncbi:MAG: flagellar hook-associated protein FlgK, partial [Negativicutes bacterium]|nr:flagellar hook-associated protein FlgK [Negativicutes bacterium]
ATITISSTDILKQFKVNSEFDAKGGTDLIAAKSANTEGEASGTNALKLAQAFSTATGTTLGSVSLNSYYTGLTGSLGTTKKAVDRSVENLTTTLTQIEGWRKSTSGVNWDEELTNMLTFQKGYSASSRVLTTMDEMLDKLINGTGVVGR